MEVPQYILSYSVISVTSFSLSYHLNYLAQCSGVLLVWLPPPSLSGCPILHSITILELNITNITTSTSIYYLLSDIIISNEIYTVTIPATNGASTGNETMYYFNTSLGNITIYYIINTVLSSTGNINTLSY